MPDTPGRDGTGRYTSKLTTADAVGFKDVEPTEYGAAHHFEANELTKRALGTTYSFKALQDCDYLRIIGGKRLYHVERMRRLMEKARGIPKVSQVAKSDPTELIDVTKVKDDTPEPDYAKWPPRIGKP